MQYFVMWVNSNRGMINAGLINYDQFIRIGWVTATLSQLSSVYHPYHKIISPTNIENATASIGECKVSQKKVAWKIFSLDAGHSSMQTQTIGC